MNIYMKGRLQTLILYFVLLIVGISIILPFFWMISTSLKTKPEIMAREVTFFPASIHLDNYRSVFRRVPYVRTLWNSLFVSVMTTVLAVFFSTMTGYGIAKFNGQGMRFLLFIILTALMIPPFVVAIPLYLVAAPLGLTNNLWAIVIPFAVSNFGIFLMHQFCLSIPDDLLYAARIDGSSEFGIFIRIVLPVVSTGAIAFAILKFLMTWNDFFFPLIMLTRETKMTLQVLLATSIDFEMGVDYGFVMALSTLIVLPVIFLFLIFQKRIMEGVALSGIKG